jgi:hypothetical protein
VVVDIGGEKPTASKKHCPWLAKQRKRENENEILFSSSITV